VAARGAGVAVLDLAAEAAGRGAGRRPGARPYAVDVRRSALVEAVVAAVEAQLGPVDIGVNVAGVLRPARAVETTEQDWDDTFGVNATGVFHVSRAVARRMVPRRRGAIVTVASNAAGVPRVGMAAYAASKAAAVMFTKCLGLELAEHGIRCNIVAPGSTDTPMQRALWPDPADDTGAKTVIAGSPESYRVGIPLGRLAEPSDIADAVAFLASDRARFITMHDLYVDGGATLRA
jgi:2,3-dihydro-2,3-dihydroxybenzoate dehydrogenase